MAFNAFQNVFDRSKSSNIGTGFNFKRKRNPFRALSFEQEPEELQTFAQNYPRPQQKSAYEQFLETGPKREDYERSKGAKIAAALLSGVGSYYGDEGAVERNQKALDRPFNRAREDYGFEAGRLKEQFGVQSAREREDRASLKAIQDYEIEMGKEARAERLAGNTLATGATNRANTEDQMRRRPLSLRQNELSGNLEEVNSDTGGRINLGSFAPSYGQKQTDTNTEFDRRDKNNFEQQKILQGRGAGFARSNMFAGKQFDLDNPSSSAGIIPPNQQRDAEEMADQELLFGPQSKYKDLVEEVPNPTSANPNATGLKLRDLNSLGVVEGQILQNLLKEYQQEKAIKIDEILNKSRRGRFEITPIK